MGTGTGTAAGGADSGARATDDEAWAALVANWSDEEAHRAYLSRFNDLDVLAVAGRRYREALARVPGDVMALRWREELIRKATVLAMSQLPQTKPNALQALPSMDRTLASALMAAGVLALLGLVAFLAWQLHAMLGSAPPGTAL